MSNWGDKPTPEDAPKFLTEEQRGQVVATERGWEIPLAGTNPEKGLMEVVVAIGGLVDNLSEGDIVDGFNDFNEEDWSVPGSSGFARQPAIFETVEFRGNQVLNVGVSSGDFDEANPEDYTKQRERMQINFGDPVQIPASVSAKVFIHKDWLDAEQELTRWIGFVAEVRNDEDVVVRYPTTAVFIDQGNPVYWGPDYEPTPPGQYINGFTPEFNEGSNPKLKADTWATMELRIREGAIDFIVQGKHVATEERPQITAGSKVSAVHIATQNYGDDVTDYYVDDVAVIHTGD